MGDKGTCVEDKGTCGADKGEIGEFREESFGGRNLGEVWWTDGGTDTLAITRVAKVSVPSV